MVRGSAEFDVGLFTLIMSMREGLPFPLLRKEIQKYLRTVSEETKQDILNRRQEILNNWVEWKDANHYVLTHIGFTDAEADMLDDKRLQSPGMRNVIRNRAIKLGYLEADKDGR